MRQGGKKFPPPPPPNTHTHTRICYNVQTKEGYNHLVEKTVYNCFKSFRWYKCQFRSPSISSVDRFDTVSEDIIRLTVLSKQSDDHSESLTLYKYRYFKALDLLVGEGAEAPSGASPCTSKF